jgi:hypothetical protein
MHADLIGALALLTAHLPAQGLVPTCVCQPGFTGDNCAAVSACNKVTNRAAKKCTDGDNHSNQCIAVITPQSSFDNHSIVIFWGSSAQVGGCNNRGICTRGGTCACDPERGGPDCATKLPGEYSEYACTH